MVKRYVLDPNCRVRTEAFGLLFYDLRGPRLLFAETGGLLEPAALEEGVRTGDGSGAVGRALPARLVRLLDALTEKGFLREQPLC